jgi:transposase
MEDWWKASLPVLAVLKGGAVLYGLFVGIDVSKDTSSAHGLDERGRKRFSLTFSMDAEGFGELVAALKANVRDLSEVTVAMESTACYHINLFSHLTARGSRVVVVNPLLISNFVKLSLRKTKTDKKDAMSIAQFLLLNWETLQQSALTSDMGELRDLSRQRESLVDQMTSIKNDMGRLLTIVFPESPCSGC